MIWWLLATASVVVAAVGAWRLATRLTAGGDGTDGSGGAHAALRDDLAAVAAAATAWQTVHEETGVLQRRLR